MAVSRISREKKQEYIIQVLGLAKRDVIYMKDNLINAIIDNHRKDFNWYFGIDADTKHIQRAVKSRENVLQTAPAMVK